MCPMRALLVLLLTAAAAPAQSPDIPSLAWRERSDWINVKTAVTPCAVGDGRADDTAAIQAALERGRDARAVYLPPGTYRITRTLVLRGPAMGCLVVGHGRDTRLVWDGPEGGRMFWSNGVAYSRYVGLSWDGRGKGRGRIRARRPRPLRDRGPPSARGIPQLHRLRYPHRASAEGCIGRAPLPQLPVRELRHRSGNAGLQRLRTIRSTGANSASAAPALSTTRATSTPGIATSRTAADPISSSAASTAARSAAARRSARDGSSRSRGRSRP